MLFVISRFSQSLFKMSAYTYSPVSKSEIRLVTFKITDQDLEASIKNVQLDPEDPIKYTALSYCWGVATDQVEVPCDGKILSITTSLHEAILAINKFSPGQDLWIDQICINQDDLAEKSEQVTKMNLIYDKAETVLAWLGPSDNTTKLGINFVKKVGEVALPSATNWFRWDDYDETHEETKLERQEELSLDQSRDLGIAFDDELSWSAFTDFFNRPWFQRMWTVQEIIQARKALVLCGEYSLDWEYISAAARWYCFKAKGLHEEHPRDVNGACLVTQMTTIPWRARLGSEYRPELLGQKTRPTCKWAMRDLLEALRPRLATDPRDKVFALVGISEIGMDDTKMAVDYSKSVRDVFTQATDAIIKNDPSDLNVIWPARQRNDDDDWPSWVPDWRLKTGTGCAYGIGEPLKGSQPGRHVYIPAEPGCLAVRGKIIGKVPYVNEYRHFGELFTNNQLREVYNACMERLTSYATDESVQTAFGLTLIGGLPLPSGLEKKNTSVETYSEKYMQFYDNTQMPQTPPEANAAREKALEETYKVGLDMSWLQTVLATYCERRFVVTDSGHMGLAHHEVLEGDVIAVVMGMHWPVVLRERDDGGYRFVGDAYCHGVMNGEALTGIVDGSEEGEVFTLK
ncbi:heterokaryon incompatibility protein-domain-containing protein [Fusarium flagelliforme]|uniref:heterokaryon incompatibility protein-domain-containing protein n=1 Tax=Fusarium flagelliforme TaxID=2675880 RepID=UPI001E8E4817|nr:heterokaryon incompatibility protein-domain-containing protein [Fusarium flagelliforme]KAH7174235.1 heterokaryon incompatibility protein-domain-containing protein [Fusarium flagelliforme]